MCEEYANAKASYHIEILRDIHHYQVHSNEIVRANRGSGLAKYAARARYDSTEVEEKGTFRVKVVALEGSSCGADITKGEGMNAKAMRAVCTRLKMKDSKYTK